MKNGVSLRVRLFRFMVLAALAAGATVAASQSASFQVYRVAAECTRAGNATYVDGKPVCDCSGNLDGGTCSCIIKCPTGGGGDIGIEEGGSQ